MDAILKESHENRWLEQGWYLALQFNEGWVCFRITGREWSGLRPFALGSVSAASNLAAWNEIQDDSARRQLSPQTTDVIFHHYWGVTPPKARVYVQFPTSVNIGNLVTNIRTITGDIGYIDGDMSPYDGPLSVTTELITIKERYPAFNIYNPLASAMTNVMLAFYTMKYTYTIIKSRSLISDLLTGQRRVRKYTMGPAEPQPMRAPGWLQKLVTKELLQYSQSLMGAE